MRTTARTVLTEPVPMQHGDMNDLENPMTAPAFLLRGASLLDQRGKQYDNPSGERSMSKTVGAFNTITGHKLSEAEGWLLLQLLKDVRQWQTPGKLHRDSAEDCVSYAALKAEALVREDGSADA